MAMAQTSLLTETSTLGNTGMGSHGVRADIHGVQELFMKVILKKELSKVKEDGRKDNLSRMNKLEMKLKSLSTMKENIETM